MNAPALRAALLPCPFCGGEASVIYDGGNEVLNQSWRAGCTLCGIRFTESGSNSWSTGNKENKAIDEAAKAKAIAAWNRRTLAQPAAAGEIVIGDTVAYGDETGQDWFRQITTRGVTFLVPLDEQDKARHILSRCTASHPLPASAGDAWIPVGERLPEDGEPGVIRQFLVYSPDRFGLRVITEHPSYWNMKDKRGRAFDGQSVTHWQPLPPHPAAATTGADAKEGGNG